MAGFFKSLFNKITNRAEIDWDDLEADLISSDLGIRMTTAILDELRDLGREISGEDVVQVTRRQISKRLPDALAPPVPRADGKPFVILVVGVNGTGKTTSSAKLGLWFKQRNHSVILAAADTFRAAAVEQLQRWGERLSISVVTGNPNADPSSVCFHAHQKAIADKVEFLICDTAGRIHTRHNLMEELGKICRTLAKQDASAPHLTLLVVDATTGSNALQQAKEFHKASPLDGLIITKLDGSGKGGIAVSIHDQLNIPPRFLGTGEEPDAFSIFQKESFVADIL
ncbi:MAG: signal recognition particle-docking protein FtsY [Akkermansiaceae bacterium]|jgi:fused signal recognition particle receptor|nr:signal recognition particle-docking protein FtsY [Akkermansiaceae bacterium]MBJ7284635.1 signal recognition particle-docking protein FtsY [Akkermansiaceae bacterium]MBJ7395447.1 signal recognition particle-docking protein FtsY [Akkermansiaceae bacterium]